jgi:hypothetical protein
VTSFFQPPRLNLSRDKVVRHTNDGHDHIRLSLAFRAMPPGHNSPSKIGSAQGQNISSKNTAKSRR